VSVGNSVLNDGGRSSHVQMGWRVNRYKQMLSPGDGDDPDVEQIQIDGADFRRDGNGQAKGKAVGGTLFLDEPS